MKLATGPQQTGAIKVLENGFKKLKASWVSSIVVVIKKDPLGIGPL